MKAIRCPEPGKLEQVQIEEPELKEGQSLIRIRRIGVCGTDLHAFEGTQPYFTYPRILGHELGGELVVAGDSPLPMGSQVTIIPYFNCGDCIACRSGKPNCCQHLKVCGVHVDGGMREYLSVPSDALVSGEGMSLEELALIEPLAIGAHGVRRAGVEPDEFVLVVGAGPIGLGTMEFARVAGGKVIALDISDQRLQFCKEKLKIEHAVNAKNPNVKEQLADITKGSMPTVVIDATGSLGAINQSFQYMAHGARYVLIGLQKGDIAFSHPEFHKREGTLMSSRNATRADFDQVMKSMRSGDVKPGTYITHELAFDDVPEQFPGLLDPLSGVVKAMISLD